MTLFILGETLCHECGKPIKAGQKFGHGGGRFRHEPCPKGEQDEN